MLAWSGQDNPGGSGLAAYDVYVSDNGGPVALAVGGTSQTSTMFNGRVGHTYRFYSVATDLAGHRASLPASFDTKTTVTTPPWQNSANPLDVTLDGHVVPGDALAIINYLNAFGPGPVPLGAVDSGPHYDVTGDGTVAPGDALAVINHLNAFGSGEGEEAGARGQEEGDRGQRFGEGGALSDLEMLALLAVDVAGQSRRRGW
jgi:hypothetical protein